MCPECLSDNVEVWEYDYGTCSQTGYRDAGERFKCHNCGATGDADDLITDEEDDMKALELPWHPGPYEGDKEALRLAYDGNPEETGGEIFFNPATGSIVVGYADGSLGDSGITFEDVLQDFSGAGQGVSRLVTMWQYATKDTTEKLTGLIKAIYPDGLEITVEETNNPKAPTDKPARYLNVYCPATDKRTRLNAGLEAFAFVPTLTSMGSGQFKFLCGYKLDMLLANLAAHLA